MFAKSQADQVPCAGCRNTSHLTPPYGRCAKEAPLSCKQIKKGKVCFGPVYEAANPEYRCGRSVCHCHLERYSQLEGSQSHHNSGGRERRTSPEKQSLLVRTGGRCPRRHNEDFVPSIVVRRRRTPRVEELLECATNRGDRWPGHITDGGHGNHEPN